MKYRLLQHFREPIWKYILNLKPHVPLDSTNPLWETSSLEIKASVWKDLHTRKFVIVLLLLAKEEKIIGKEREGKERVLNIQ